MEFVLRHRGDYSLVRDQFLNFKAELENRFPMSIMVDFVGIEKEKEGT